MAFRWGDAEDDEGLEDVLPPRQVIGPDHRGIKSVVEWRRDEESGAVVKVTTTSRVVKKKLNPAVKHRRELAKFGDAVGQTAADNYTVVSVEDIVLEKSSDGQAKPQELTDLAPNTSIIICRTCGRKGDHWTSKCPYKDVMKDAKPDEDGTPGGTTSTGTTSSYVAPGRRAGSKPGTDYRSRDDSNSIRVTNLSEDTREADLQELFRPFGPISRTYVAFDRDTGLSRGFAFINFVNREDAVRAIKKLDGYGYDNLILRVEWATPREK